MMTNNLKQYLLLDEEVRKTLAKVKEAKEKVENLFSEMDVSWRKLSEKEIKHLNGMKQEPYDG